VICDVWAGQVSADRLVLASMWQRSHFFVGVDRVRRGQPGDLVQTASADRILILVKGVAGISTAT